MAINSRLIETILLLLRLESSPQYQDFPFQDCTGRERRVCEPSAPPTAWVCALVRAGHLDRTHRQDTVLPGGALLACRDCSPHSPLFLLATSPPTPWEGPP